MLLRGVANLRRRARRVLVSRVRKCHRPRKEDHERCREDKAYACENIHFLHLLNFDNTPWGYCSQIEPGHRIPITSSGNSQVAAIITATRSVRSTYHVIIRSAAEALAIHVTFETRHR